MGTFKDTGDWGYEWNGAEHFLRLYYDTETRTHTVVCLTEDEAITHTYVKLVSRASNFPFAASLKQSPDHRLHWD